MWLSSKDKRIKKLERKVKALEIYLALAKSDIAELRVALARAEDAAQKGNKARAEAGGLWLELQEIKELLASIQE